MALIRPHYFAGQLLTAEDLNEEQNYFSEKRRRHNRFLHGYGVVWGLEVTVGKGVVRIKQGFALDCMGNEIELCEPIEVKLRVPAKQKQCFVVVEYQEFPSNGESERHRIREGFRAYFQEINPSLSHKCPRRQKTCGKSHAIPIGRLLRARRAWHTACGRGAT